MKILHGQNHTIRKTFCTVLIAPYYSLREKYGNAFGKQHRLRIHARKPNRENIEKRLMSTCKHKTKTLLLWGKITWLIP